MSSGTQRELQLARSLGMKVFGDDMPFRGVTRIHAIVDDVQHWATERVTQPMSIDEFAPKIEEEEKT